MNVLQLDFSAAFARAMRHTTSDVSDCQGRLFDPLTALCLDPSFSRPVSVSAVGNRRGALDMCSWRFFRCGIGRGLAIQAHPAQCGEPSKPTNQQTMEVALQERPTNEGGLGRNVELRNRAWTPERPEMARGLLSFMQLPCGF